MRKTLFLILLAVIVPVLSWSQAVQPLKLRNGNLDLPANAPAFAAAFQPKTEQLFAGRYYLVAQFDAIPTQPAKEALEKSGVRFLEYLPENAYILSLPSRYDLQNLVVAGVRSFMLPNERIQFSSALYQGEYPEWALFGDKIELTVMPYRDVLPTMVATELGKYFEVMNENQHPRFIRLRVETTRLYHLLQFPYIQFIEPIAAPSTPDDFAGRSLHRSNCINTDYAAGRHYDGTGVTVGLADDGTIGPHIDHQGRVTQFATTNNGTHGDMTSGIFFGAGNREPKIQGHASGAYCYYWDISGYVHIVSAINHYTNYGMVLTSTSYSQGTGGVYTADAQFIDDQINDNRQMEHIFSAGNAGSADHGYGAGAGWANITGGYKAAKSVITCGDMNNIGVLESTSSRGPADDGRIKPDICTNGFGQLSTDENNTTQTGSGTSAAAPSVAGCVTQLYHAYKSLNGGQNPQSGLIKACILNTGEEVGNAGPDYKHGWGRMNALRAVRVLEDNRYLKDSVSQGGTRTHNLTVPAGTIELRVMVYWTDYPGNPSANKALVNDLNIQVTNGTTYNPWVLDETPTATALNTPATRGIDDLNNMEQVTIANPIAGSATVTVSGFSVPQGPQNYWLVYEFVQPMVEVTYPIGGEGFVPGEAERIRWDAFGATGNFTLEYTTNNGTNWTLISNTVASTARTYTWTVPTNITGLAKVRVTAGALTDMSDATFSIARLPTNINITYICPDSIGISWTAAAGATGYEVSILGTKYMDSVATSSTTSAVIRNQNPNVDHWYSVRSLQGNGKGRRAIAIFRAGGTFNCTIPVDIAATQIVSPGAGSVPSCQASASTPVTVRIQNNGTGPASNIPVGYSFNGGPAFTETYAGPLAAGAFANHTFATTVNLSAAGTYTLEAWADLSGDGNSFNDSLSQSTTITTGGATVNLPQNQNFESFTGCSNATNCGTTICGLGSGWINETNGSQDDIDWRVASGATASANTGPDVDHTLGTAQGKYVYLEASACFNSTAQMLTPCINLAGATGPQLSFWYHMNGANMGTLHVDVLSNGAWTLDAMTPITGNQGNQWRQGTLNLVAYIGTVINIRFRGTTGSDFASDMALDDIGILETSAVPVAAFVGSPTTTCPGSTVTFTDQSTNSPNSWAWTITPGTFSYTGGTTANSQNPQVQFSAPGTYSVTLLATNGFGNNTSTQSNYITITNGSVPNIVEDIQGVFPPAGWAIVNSGGAFSWAQSVSVTGSNGAPTLAAYVENFTYNNPNAEDKLVTFPVDLTALSTASMTFDVAYARFNATLFDGLRIEVSTDCGATWPNVVYDKSDSVLATTSDQAGNWFPSLQTDWRNDQVDLTPYAGQVIMIRFVNINGYGNNLFIDNINITSLVGLAGSLGQLGLQVWPNPANGLFNVSISELPVASTQFEVCDLAGRSIWKTTVQGNGGAWQGAIDLRALARGVYYLRVQGDSFRGVKKLVIE
ncbi:MAG: S8 family serine peptidase [Bacteroidetes bacterium]|nr:S8 family serine peptidase [Bacteroidota bacterium]MBP6639545.1 S8 family serine peptidase [Bacteroidia bacterium]